GAGQLGGSSGGHREGAPPVCATVDDQRAGADVDDPAGGSKSGADGPGAGAAGLLKRAGVDKAEVAVGNRGVAGKLVETVVYQGAGKATAVPGGVEIKGAAQLSDEAAVG